MVIQSIFISRKPEEIADLVDACHAWNVHLTARSLITFRGLSFDLPEVYEVIFFSSKRAIDFFLQNSLIPTNCELACVGTKTAQVLLERGYSVSFIGEKAGKPESIAEDFKTWLGTRTVLIPRSYQSKRTIADAIQPEQCIEVIAYETIAESTLIDVHDLYVFSSPSNYLSFIEENPSPQRGVIAWGETTRKEILKNGVQPIYTLETANEKELLNWLKTQLLLL